MNALRHAQNHAMLLGMALWFLSAVPAQAQSVAEQAQQAALLQQQQLEQLQQGIAPTVSINGQERNQTQVPDLNPLWSQVRQGERGRSTSTTPYSDSLINQYDPALYETRAGWLSTALALSLFGMIIVFAAFILVNGAAKLEKGFSGLQVQRWQKVDIWLHWLMAIPCILLILTGLALMTGRFVFGHWLGPDGVAALAAAAKPIHDYMALPFSFFALIAMVRWARNNIPAGYDLTWFTMVGGYLNFGPFKGKHPDAGFANGGEKLWFWSFTLFGLALIASGLVMLFPNWLCASRTGLLTAILVHGLAAVVITGFTVVHIFMATVLSEGSFPAMVSGYCDENWAKQHHNVWFDEIKADGSIRYREPVS